MNQTKNVEWRERIDALHEALKAGQIDFADDSEAEKVKAVIDDEFTRQMNSLRAYDKRKNTAMNDEEYHAAQRRKEALYRMLPEVYDRFGKKYPDMNLAEDGEDDVAVDVDEVVALFVGFTVAQIEGGG